MNSKEKTITFTESELSEFLRMFGYSCANYAQSLMQEGPPKIPYTWEIDSKVSKEIQNLCKSK